jgi:hypothetical protein
MALILAFMPLRSQAQDEPEVLRPAKFELIDFDPESLPVDGPTASVVLGFAALESKEDVLGEQGEVEKPEVKEYDSKPEVKEYDSLDEAQQDLNDHIAQPSWMPDSFSDQVAGVMIVEASSAEYTVDLAKVESVTQEVGIGPIVLPPETDGAVLMLDAPAKVILAYGADTESPDFVLAQMRMPTLTIPGEVNVEAVRLALLAAMPSDLQPLASQLESISDWKNTFPVLAPKDAGAVEVEVSGNQGVLIIPPDDDQKLLVWSQNDYLFGVFTRNSISSDDLVRLASSVR